MTTTTHTETKNLTRETPAATTGARTDTAARPRWAVLAFWTGVVADGIMAVAMVYPLLWATILKIDAFAPSLRYRVDMGIGAALMCGWTALLAWGAQRPVERRGVLLLTAFPVIAGIYSAAIAAVATGLSSAAALRTILIGLPALAVLMVVGYLDARRVERAAR